MAKLRKNYQSFESKRQLCTLYDVFICDDAIYHLLPKLLGKAFFSRKKWVFSYQNMFGHTNVNRNQTSYRSSRTSMHCWCVLALRPIFNVDALRAVIVDFVLQEITKFYKVNLHRSFPKQSLEYFSFSCCKCILLLSFFIFWNYFVNIMYIFVNFALWRLCVWRNGSHYTPSCGKTKVTWLFAVDSVEAVFSLGHGLKLSWHFKAKKMRLFGPRCKLLVKWALE